jgi:hypothetical protein
MRAAISKIIGLMIFISAACAFADTKLPKCVIFTFGHCQGSLKYPNGDIYTGEFNYGQPNGVGKMTYANGDLYAGNFFEGQKHGVGDYTWADGNRYIGQFIAGNLEGRGAYYFLGKNKTNPDKYVGDFKKNVFNGDGVYTYGNGAVVSGKFKDGRKVDDLSVITVAEAKSKTVQDSGVNQTIKYEEKNAQALTVSATKSNGSKGKELLALADVSRPKDEKSRLENQRDSQAELNRKPRLNLEAEVAVAAIDQEKKIPQGDVSNTEFNKTEQDHLNAEKAKGSTVKDVGVSIDSNITLDRNNEPNESNRSRPQNKYMKNFFITGSINLVDITAGNFYDANGLFGKSKFGGAPKELPYSLGFGYNFAENYGLELSFKNHGSQMAVPTLLDERIFKSSSILIGGFLEFPIDPKLSLGLKYGAHSTESTYSAKNYLYRIDNQDSLRDYDFVNKSINDYYGYSISYLINRQNKLSLNWIRLKSVFSVVGDSTTPYSTDINTDVTEIAYKYNF